MSDVLVHIYDEDEYMYPKPGESDKEYKARMKVLREKRNARMSEEEKQLVEDTLKAFGNMQTVAIR